MTTVVITGDSHTGALVTGAHQVFGEKSDVVIKPVGLGGQRNLCEPFFEVDSDRIRLTHPELKLKARSLPPGDAAVGDAFYVMSVGFHTAHFFWTVRSHAPIRCRAAEKWVASDGALRTMVENKQQYQKALVREMKALGFRFVVVESPRLFRSASYFEGANTCSILYIDQLVREDFAEFLQQEAVDVVRVPAEMTDADGYMLPEWKSSREGDNHHANGRFGAAMVPAIWEYVRKSELPALEPATPPA